MTSLDLMKALLVLNYFLMPGGMHLLVVSLVDLAFDKTPAGFEAFAETALAEDAFVVVVHPMRN